MNKVIIEIWSDFACPYCYIGQQRIDRVIDSLGIKDQVFIIHKSYQLNPFAPTLVEKNAYEVYGEKLGISSASAKEKLQALALIAKEEMIEMNYGLVKMTNTFDAHRLAKISEDPIVISALHHALLKAYFKDGKNLADTDVLVSIGVSVGLDSQLIKKYLSSQTHEEEVRNDILEARSLGIRGVPYFLINRKYAISGAQPFEVFKATLQKVIKEQ